jgi:hypothetical protein
MGKWDGDKVLYKGLKQTIHDKEIWTNQWAIVVVNRNTGKEIAKHKYEKGDYFSRERAKNKAMKNFE